MNVVQVVLLYDSFVTDLLPVSSTVIPLSIYKVGYEVSVTSDNKHDKLDTPAKLITGQWRRDFRFRNSGLCAQEWVTDA